MLPNVAAVLGLLTLAHYPTSRVLIVGAILLFGIGAMWLFGKRDGRPLSVLGPLPLCGLMTAIVAHAFVVILTGGIFSPLLPSLLAVSVAAFHVFGRRRASMFAFVITFGLIASSAGIPGIWCGPRVRAPYDVILMLWSLFHALLMLRAVSLYMADAQRATGDALATAREDLLAATLERNKSLEAIGSRVAHELKNPLASIKALVRLVRKGSPDPTAQERLEVVENEVTRMERILRDYLSFSRPLEELRPQPVELGVLVDDVLAALEGRASTAGVRVERTPSSATIVGDPRRLKEALLNLMGNAIEATPHGGSVTVSVREHAGGARVVIEDSGKGMSDADLQRLGTPFFTTRDGGTGLGVVLARAVVVQHGGTLEYASEIGKGTTATVTLPYRPLGTEPAARASASATATAGAAAAAATSASAETAEVARPPTPSTAPAE